VAYRDEVLADSPLAYLRLGEASGTAAADEVGAHAGTYVNTPTLGAAGAVSGNTAVSFDAAQSERVTWTTLGTLGQNVIASAWEFWIKTTTTGQGVILGAFNTGTSLAIQFQLNRAAADTVAVGKTRIYVRGTNGNQLYGEIATNIYDGAWHHVKVTFPSTTTIKVRIDKVDRTVTYGLQQAVASTANFGFALALAARNLRGVFDNFASIALDEVAVYSAGLSDARSDAHYDAAAGATVYDLAGSIAGSGSLSGNLQLVRPLAGSIAGSSSLTGNLQRMRELAGAVAGAAVLSGNLQRVQPLAGQVTGAGTLTGDLQRLRYLAGSVQGSAVLTGDLTKVAPSVLHELAGTVSGAGVLTADLQALRALEGLVAGAGGLEGALAVDQALEGLLAGSGSLSGDLTVVAVVIELPELTYVFVSPFFTPGTVVDVVPRTRANSQPWAHERIVRRPRQLSRRVAVRPPQEPVASAVAGEDGTAAFEVPAGDYWLVGEREGAIRYVARTVP
jgi:hypothetical protein